MLICTFSSGKDIHHFCPVANLTPYYPVGQSPAFFPCRGEGFRTQTMCERLKCKYSGKTKCLKWTCLLRDHLWPVLEEGPASREKDWVAFYKILPHTHFKFNSKTFPSKCRNFQVLQIPLEMRRWQVNKDLPEFGRAIVRQILVPVAAGDFNPQYSWEINLLGTTWRGPIRFSL